ncbi:GNAT family N-acetyltransferase [Oceanobacillus sojae]|uniref:N-acetyltransferase domain-containing protein n=1 Tax=Oceanobacillus sojae TaxID=582851 RepID=A0A511ZR07_9BACI|nr:GNAT family N-acetyltransferase [Oceanobacillus sojae]GEN89885.1 hypothetical protein OSO01_46240 [Oceanobacillus sojae]
MVLIREARTSDAGGMGKVNVESWQTSYQGIIDNRFLQQLSVEDKKQKWKNIIQAGDSIILVAVDTDDKVVGYITISTKESEASAGTDQVTALYLLEDWQGKGIGKALLLEGFKRFLDLSVHTVQVEVLAENRSRLFYERLGAELVEKKEIQIAGDVLDLLVYEWKDISEIVSV